MFLDLSYIDELLLKSVGTDDSLIKTIRKNVSEHSKEETELYNAFLNNYQGYTIEQTVNALQAAKEYVRLFENDGCRIELVKYYKEAIPVLEKSLNVKLYGEDTEAKEKTI